MARGLIMLLKWLVIPAALAAAGYYFIGPSIGKMASAPVQVDKPPTESTQTTTAPQPNDAPADHTSYPTPDVSVTRGNSKEGAHAVTHHHHRKKPKHDDSATNPVVPPPDQGGSGGAATTGGDTGGDTGGTGKADTGGAGGTTG